MLLRGPGKKTNVGGGVDLAALPSFFVIGPPRTGTSWIHAVLSECATVSNPTKETRFFDKHFQRGLAWYQSHYRHAVAGRIVGEVAPTYFASPQARERIAQLIPQAKIVCTFRNPAERVISLYRLKRAYGLIRWNLDDALTRDPELMESGRYATYLRDWLQTFGESQVMVTMFEELQADPQAYVNRLLDFVGIPRMQLRTSHRKRLFTIDAMTEPRNYFWTRGGLLLADWSRKHRIDSVVHAAKRLGAAKLFIGGGPTFPDVPASQHIKLRELFRSEVDQLEGMLNLDLTAWK